MSNYVDRVLMVVLAAAAIAVLVTRIGSFGQGPRIISTLDQEPVYVESWQDAIPVALRAGGGHEAPVKMIVFSDYECPGCRLFHQVTKQLLAERSDEVQILHVHFPLPNHRFAKMAAQAAECADAVGRYHEWVDVVYEKQDSIGLKDWKSFAIESGIADPEEYEHCVTAGETSPNIQAGQIFGRDFGVKATPTFIVDGWMYEGAYPLERLDALIDARLRNSEL